MVGLAMNACFFNAGFQIRFKLVFTGILEFSLVALRSVSHLILIFFFKKKVLFRDNFTKGYRTTDRFDERTLNFKNCRT